MQPGYVIKHLDINKIWRTDGREQLYSRRKCNVLQIHWRFGHDLLMFLYLRKIVSLYEDYIQPLEICVSPQRL